MTTTKQQRAEWRRLAEDARHGFDDSIVGEDEATQFTVEMAEAVPALLDENKQLRAALRVMVDAVDEMLATGSDKFVLLARERLRAALGDDDGDG